MGLTLFSQPSHQPAVVLGAGMGTEQPEAQVGLVAAVLVMVELEVLELQIKDTQEETQMETLITMVPLAVAAVPVE
jgi:hypothetical protein